MKQNCTSKGDVASGYCLREIMLPLVCILRCLTLSALKGVALEIGMRCNKPVRMWSRTMFIVDEERILNIVLASVKHEQC